MTTSFARNAARAARTGKPHIGRINGQWGVFCPTGRVHDAETLEAAQEIAFAVGFVLSVGALK